MTIAIEILRSKLMEARKERDLPRVQCLSSAIGEIERKMPDRLYPADDELVVKTISKLIQGTKEVMAIFCDAGDTVRVDRANFELSVLEPIFEIIRPHQMPEAELHRILLEFKANNPGAKIGDYMGYLNKTYFGQIDRAAASAFIKTL